MARRTVILLVKSWTCGCRRSREHRVKRPWWYHIGPPIPGDIRQLPEGMEVTEGEITIRPGEVYPGTCCVYGWLDPWARLLFGWLRLLTRRDWTFDTLNGAHDCNLS